MSEPAIEQKFALAIQLKKAGRLSEAEGLCREILAKHPNHADALHQLALIAIQENQIEKALEFIRQAIAINPREVVYQINLGNMLSSLGRYLEAMNAYQAAVQLKPEIPEAHYNLGLSLYNQGHTAAAIAAYREAIRLKPDYALAYNNLGVALTSQGEFDSGIAAYSRALQLRPNYLEIYTNLGNALKDQGRLDEAIANFRAALALKPDAILAHSNLIYAMHFHSDDDARAIHEEQRRWNRQHADPLKQLIRLHNNNRDPERRLCIGYVSPDFRQHVVGWNLLPLLEQHNHKEFKIICYSGVSHPDNVTEQIRSCSDEWRNIGKVADEQMAQMIRDDGVDILIDLTLHMAGNRLLVFARKPAPVQITYLGYCGSTGLDAIDYRFSDPYLDPPGTDLSVYSEQTVRLPETYWCYRPGGQAPIPAPPPILIKKFITFGCLNNFTKVSTEAMDLWAKILLSAPKSRLLIHANPGSHLPEVRGRFNTFGVLSDRIEFIGRRPSWTDYLNTFSQIDVALDPFPYCGWITTCDGLWMGVPVVSLPGRTAASRGGKSILTNIGLSELIADTPEEYVNIAIKLANDLPRLRELRSTLRERMESSPLMNAERLLVMLKPPIATCGDNGAQNPTQYTSTTDQLFCLTMRANVSILL